MQQSWQPKLELALQVSALLLLSLTFQVVMSASILLVILLFNPISPVLKFMQTSAHGYFLNTQLAKNSHYSGGLQGMT